jgi:hypothetical protein
VPVVVWRDAAGTLVGPGVFEGESTLYFDARGLVWLLDFRTGALTAPTKNVGYDAGDCMEKAYVLDATPRRVFSVEGDSANTFRVMPDARSFVKARIKSTRYGMDCINEIERELDVLPLADTLPAMPIVKPAVSFVGPLHLSRE